VPCLPQEAPQQPPLVLCVCKASQRWQGPCYTSRAAGQGPGRHSKGDRQVFLVSLLMLLGGEELACRAEQAPALAWPAGQTCNPEGGVRGSTARRACRRAEEGRK
jgi:hypothetical protein